MEENITIVRISPEYLYLIVIGNKNQVDLLVQSLNLNEKKTNRYYSLKTHDSITSLCNSLNDTINNSEKTMKKHIIVDDGVESAQTYSYVDRTCDNLYMLLEFTEYEDECVLGFPKFELGESDPITQIEMWFKNKATKIPKGIMKNLKMITVVGAESNILVMSTRLAKKINTKQIKNK
jgi:hypothetical protein